MNFIKIVFVRVIFHDLRFCKVIIHTRIRFRLWTLRLWTLRLWTLRLWTLRNWTIRLWTLRLWTLRLWTRRLWTLRLWTLRLWTLLLLTLRLWTLRLWTLRLWTLIHVDRWTFPAYFGTRTAYLMGTVPLYGTLKNFKIYIFNIV